MNIFLSILKAIGLFFLFKWQEFLAFSKFLWSFFSWLCLFYRLPMWLVRNFGWGTDKNYVRDLWYGFCTMLVAVCAVSIVTLHNIYWGTIIADLLGKPLLTDARLIEGEKVVDGLVLLWVGMIFAWTGFEILICTNVIRVTRAMKWTNQTKKSVYYYNNKEKI